MKTLFKIIISLVAFVYIFYLFNGRTIHNLNISRKEHSDLMKAVISEKDSLGWSGEKSVQHKADNLIGWIRVDSSIYLSSIQKKMFFSKRVHLRSFFTTIDESLKGFLKNNKWFEKHTNTGSKQPSGKESWAAQKKIVDLLMKELIKMEKIYDYQMIELDSGDIDLIFTLNTPFYGKRMGSVG